MSTTNATPPSQPPDPPFLPTHTAVVLLAAALIGLIAGTLTFLADRPAPTAVLTGLGAAGISIPVLRSLIG
ncbi:hypothetical protein [Streptomyces olivaceiscleroticus]|uniref:SpdD protein n=1 Tax=Streptomyces olivaceiscleroticus TaxID=68245 RepID=A0ABN1ADL8_9ACTN